jgi:pilus assembly protein CpaB
MRWYPRRWSPRSKLFLVLAVVCGATAFAIVRGYAARIEALRPLVGRPIPIVVAAAPLARGAVLTQDMLQVASVPEAFAQPGALRSIEQAVGHALVADIAQGEVLTRTRIGSSGGPVAAQVPSGLRAFVVASGMPPGTVRAGDRVDVLATFGGQRPYTDTVATGLEVLTVLAGERDAFAASGSQPGPALVLLVTPDAAERLAYASAFATLTVTIAGTEP